MSDDRKESKPQDGGFDTTAELWDRLADDIAASGGSPCADTVVKLVEDACQHDPNPTRRREPDSE